MKIDYSRNDRLTDFAKIVLKDQLLLENEDPQEGFARAAIAFSADDKELAQRLYDYASLGWFTFATPLLANGGTSRGLPISCFLNYVPDSVQGLADNLVENVFLATGGGGIGSYWGHVRSVGESTSKGIETPGLIPFLHVQDSQMLAYHQGKTRRGQAAAYIDVSHPEILEFIEMRSPTGGDVNRKNMNMHHGINITDKFMHAVLNDDEFDLVDPNSKRVTDTIKARTIWIRILQARVKQGEPYLFFVDTANEALPVSQKKLGLKVHHSNLCIEISLPTSKDRTAVCCLSSINIAMMDEWIDVAEQFIGDLVTMLDNTLDVFINEAPKELWRAVNSAKKERAVGLGQLGFATLLQKKGIAFESNEARFLNSQIASLIYKNAVKQSRKLAETRGEPDDMKGTGLRNSHLLAIAPNATSSIIAGVSPSIEPYVANCFAHKTKSGTFFVKNAELEKVLDTYGKNTKEVWDSINEAHGSVQHLDWLEEKDIFKTAAEIDQVSIVTLASDRQPWICQSQSVNLFMPANVNAKYLSDIHILAWKSKMKSLYYLRSSAVRKTNLGKVEINDECAACHA